MFIENEEVIYQGIVGKIVFVTSSYIVIELPPAPNLNPARLLIPHSEYSKVQREK